ncbi:MAG TPA: hypothetical protein VEC58_08810, partial [Roseiarcus sp.]|nr:hypothetical protein [Roseiarcus sp.]
MARDHGLSARLDAQDIEDGLRRVGARKSRSGRLGQLSCDLLPIGRGGVCRDWGDRADRRVGGLRHHACRRSHVDHDADDQQRADNR